MPTTNTLANTVSRARQATPPKRQPLKTRRPTGKPPWPLILLAGAEKAGKSYSAALATASPLVGRSFWIGVGEDDPDEYGAIPGADFEIVEHDGTYPEIVRAIDAAVAEPREDPNIPNMIVLDSGSRLWDMLGDEAQAIASSRKGGNTDAPISMDLWNRANHRWQAVMNLLRAHNGPVIITARLETVTVMEDGKPTTAKEQKVKGQKGLPFDVGVVIQMPKRGEVYLTGVRSLRIDVSTDQKKPIQNFSLPKLWQELGVVGEGATSERQHSGADGERSAQKSPDWRHLFEQAKATGRIEALEELRDRAEKDGLPPTFPLFEAIDAEMQAIATAE